MKEMNVALLEWIASIRDNSFHHIPDTCNLLSLVVIAIIISELFILQPVTGFSNLRSRFLFLATCSSSQLIAGDSTGVTIIMTTPLNLTLKILKAENVKAAGSSCY